MRLSRNDFVSGLAGRLKQEKFAGLNVLLPKEQKAARDKL
jgi:hypothetical protein